MKHALPREERARRELEQAERWLSSDPAQRRFIWRAAVVAFVFHAVMLVARMPNWGPDPVRVDAPMEQAMKIQFLSPPAAPKAEPKPPEPEKKKIPRPDPRPDEPEPVKAAPPPPPAAAPPGPPAVQQTGPIRVSAGQGPGLIKKVEPRYPEIARTTRMEGKVVVDAIILKDGSVSDVKILSSTSALFERACIEAVRQWRFTPGPHDVILTVTVNFTLN